MGSKYSISGETSATVEENGQQTDPFPVNLGTTLEEPFLVAMEFHVPETENPIVWHVARSTLAEAAYGVPGSQIGHGDISYLVIGGDDISGDKIVASINSDEGSAIAHLGAEGIRAFLDQSYGVADERAESVAISATIDQFLATL